MKATVSHRKPYPGETCFGGGKGILIPYRPDQTNSSAEPSSDEAASSSAAQEATPDVATLDLYDMVKDHGPSEADIEALTVLFRQAIRLHYGRGE